MARLGPLIIDGMARGWESKSIESQIESANSDAQRPGKQLTEEQKTEQRERANLLLSRSYVQQQLAATQNQLYAKTLRKALDEIEEKLRKTAEKESRP